MPQFDEEKPKKPKTYVLLLAAAAVVIDDDDDCRIVQRGCIAVATIGRGAAVIDTHARGGGGEGLARRAQRIRAAPRTARERISFFFFFSEKDWTRGVEKKLRKMNEQALSLFFSLSFFSFSFFSLHSLPLSSLISFL